MPATKTNFSERNLDQPIVFDGSINEIAEGCSIELESDGVTLTAKVIACNAGQAWTAEITGFLNFDNNEHGNLKVGSTIEFEDRNVLRCAA